MGRHPVTVAGRYRYPWIITALTIGGALLRVARLDNDPLWRDEAFTALVASRPVGPMLDAVRHDSAPPLAYLLTHTLLLLGNGTAMLRLGSVVAGTAAIPIAAALGRRIDGWRGGVSAAVGVAASPAMLASSRDARMYALTTTLVLLSSLLLWRALERPSGWRLLALGVTAAAAVTSDYFAIPALVAQTAAAIILRPRARSWILAAATVATGSLALVPWLIYARSQFSHGQSAFWVEPLSLHTLGGVFLQMLSGRPVEAAVPGRWALQTAQGVALVAGVVSLACLAWRREPPLRCDRGAGFLAVTGFGMVGLLAGASLWHPLLEARYVSVGWGPLLVLVGIGAGRLGNPWRSALTLIAMAASGVVTSQAPLNPEIPAMVSRIGQLGPHDVVLAGPAEYLVVLASEDNASREKTHVVGSDIAWFWGTAAYPEDAAVASAPPDVVAHAGDVWWIAAPTEGPPPLPSTYTQRSMVCAAQACVTLYSPRPNPGDP